jgi:uncharacterized membrane protein (DUF373 family)
MKKILLIALICFSYTVKANESVDAVGKAVEKGTETVYADGKEVTKTLYADGKEVVKTVYNDGKELIKSETVSNAVSSIAKGLKVAVAEVWRVLTMQQVVKSVTNLCIYIVLLVLIIIGVNYAKSTYRAHLILNGYNPAEPSTARRIDLDDSAKGVASVIISIITIACVIALFVFGISSMTETVTGFVNPQYGAIQEVLQAVNPR